MESDGDTGADEANDRRTRPAVALRHDFRPQGLLDLRGTGTDILFAWIKRDEDGSVAKQKFQSERINAREWVRRCLLDLRGMRLMMKNWTTEGGDPIYTIR